MENKGNPSAIQILSCKSDKDAERKVLAEAVSEDKFAEVK
jgi:hypothetical protein